jgi:hypothetical protein
MLDNDARPLRLGIVFKSRRILNYIQCKQTKKPIGYHIKTSKKPLAKPQETIDKTNVIEN